MRLQAIPPSELPTSSTECWHCRYSPLHLAFYVGSGDWAEAVRLAQQALLSAEPPWHPIACVMAFRGLRIMPSLSQVWCHMPVISALVRQKQEGSSRVQGKPGLHSEFQDSQGYEPERPCLKRLPDCVCVHMNTCMYICICVYIPF